MKYLGIAKQEKSRIVMPDGFDSNAEGQTYEAVEVGGDILLVPVSLDRERISQIHSLAKESIKDHRKKELANTENIFGSTRRMGHPCPGPLDVTYTSPTPDIHREWGTRVTHPI